MTYIDWLVCESEQAIKNSETLAMLTQLEKLGLLASVGKFKLGNTTIDQMDVLELDYFYSMTFLPSVN